MPTSRQFTPNQVVAILGISPSGGGPTNKKTSAPAGGGQDPLGLAKAVGQRMVYESREAFRNQEWNGKKWPERYPNQGQPKVNVAGIVSDLRQGFKPAKRRFVARPALEDTGRLIGSITYRAKGPFEVEVGSNVPYASLMQTGGISRQSVSKSVRKNLAQFLRDLRGTKKGSKKKGQKRKKRKKGPKDLIAQRLGFLFSVEQLETQIVPRQFLGVNEQIEKALAKSIESYFDKFGG